MKGIVTKEWNDDVVTVSSAQNEQFKSHDNTLKVIVPIVKTNNKYGLYEIGTSNIKDSFRSNFIQKF